MNRWGYTFKKGDLIAWIRPNGERWPVVYVGLAKPSSFSRAYGKQALVKFGGGLPQEAGYDDLVPRTPGRGNPEVGDYTVKDAAGTVVGQFRATHPVRLGALLEQAGVIRVEQLGFLTPVVFHVEGASPAGRVTGQLRCYVDPFGARSCHWHDDAKKGSSGSAARRLRGARCTGSPARTCAGSPARTRSPSVPGVRVFDQGSEYRVTASERFVYDWSLRWPGSSLRHLDGGVSFTFDKRNGDLVDLSPDGLDGPDVLALSEDLQRIGARRLGLSGPEHRRR